jgi:simple sugar transport system permease protein
MDIGMLLLITLPVALRAMVPIALAAIGEVFAERAGVVNIGLEGILVISAFAAVVGAWLSGNPWVGLALGMLAGAMVGLLHGFISVYLKGDQIISGVGINLLGIGLVGFGAVVLWGGKSSMVESGLQIPGIPVPWGSLSPLVPVTVLVALITWWLLQRTAFGLQVQAVGENPEAADVVGVPVERVRLIAVLYGGILGGLGGAFLSLDWLGTITNTLPAGRGFIALATVVFSKLNPLLALFGGFLFGYFDALAIQLASAAGGSGQAIPYQFVRMIPYIATLVVVAGAIGQARFPKAIAQPYRRE